MLEQIGKSNGLDITTQCICKANYGLEDHINDALVESELMSNSYDFVIFQQGPSSQAYGRESLLEYGKLLAVMALENKASPAYLMVWPSMAYYQTFDGVIKNHTDAAKSNGVLLIPVGSIWQKLSNEHPDYQLYGPDGFHPSELGSLLEAIVILKSIQPSMDIGDLKSDSMSQILRNDDTIKEFLSIVSDYLNER